MPKILSKNVKTISNYLKITEKIVDFGNNEEIYHSIKTSDYTSAVVTTNDDKYVLVKQFRPAVEAFTLELVAGTLDQIEKPIFNIKKELMEETGLSCDYENIYSLGKSFSDTGRNENSLHSFFIDKAEYIKGDVPISEEGIEVIFVNKSELIEMIKNGKFNHSLHLSTILLAIAKKYITLDS